MTENIILARKYLLQNEDQKALSIYLKENESDSKNPEAAYVVYNTYCTNCIDKHEPNDKIKLAFLAVSETLEKAIKYVAASEGSEDDNMRLVARFLGWYLPIANYAVKNPITSPSERIQLAVTTLYTAGNTIAKAFGSTTDALIVANIAWKEGVKLQQQFYAYSYDGNKVEDYVAKIQKTEPSYVVPKKAGCISKG